VVDSSYDLSARSRLVIDLDIVERNFRSLSAALPHCRQHFAVKCLPDATVLRTLAALGCGFEVASAGEIRFLRECGLFSDAIVFAAPIKSRADIAYAYEVGVRRFVADSTDEIDKLAELAPGTDVLLRLSVDSAGSVMPLSQKFGVMPGDVVPLAVRAEQGGLVPSGLTFHVGSQAEDLGVWQKALVLVAETMEALARRGIRIKEVDLGGGFPATYGNDVPDVGAIGRAVADGVASLPYEVALLAEPGRYLVASAGELHAQVIGRALRFDEQWIYVNAGVYHGLAEASPGVAGLAFPVRTGAMSASVDALQSCVVAGHSCDGTDVIGRFDLPTDLAVGDELIFEHAGAYCLSYVTQFCGIDGPVIDFAAR
jgi:ornithine decarboxylase